MNRIDSKITTSRQISRKRTQAERTALSEARMFEAAISIIAERGTQDLSLREVGEAAGYSRGLVSMRFGTKETFLTELIRHWAARWSSELAEAVVEERGLKAIEGWVNAVSALWRDHPKDIRALFLLCYETIGSSPNTRETIARSHDEFHARLIHWIEEAAQDEEISPTDSAEQLALHLKSSYYGLIYFWIVDPDSVRWPDTFLSVFRSWRSYLTRSVAKPS